MKNTNIMNNTNQSLSIHAIVLRVWNDTTFEQELEWPKNTTIEYVLHKYQRDCLGSPRVYKIIDFYVQSFEKNEEN